MVLTVPKQFESIEQKHEKLYKNKGRDLSLKKGQLPFQYLDHKSSWH